MKRKAIKRKTVKKRPALQAKPLLELWDGPPDGPLGLLPGKHVGAVCGVPLPADFDAVIGFHAGECLLEHRNYMEIEPWKYWCLRLCHDGNEYDNGTVEQGSPRYFFYWDKPPPPRIDENGNDLSEPDGWNGENLDLNDRQWFAVGVAMRDAMREGFQLAVLRYADQLKSNPEAAAMLAAARANSKKGAVARRKQAAPNHRKIQKLFRELRKTSPKKTVRYLRVAEKFKMSDRQIARIVDGID